MNFNYVMFGRDHAREATVLTLRVFTLSAESEDTKGIFLASIPETGRDEKTTRIMEVLDSIRAGRNFINLNSEETAVWLNDLLIHLHGDSHVGSAKVQLGSR